MTPREKAICEIFTGICFCAGERRQAVYEYASELLGRPVLTHEFYTFAEELKEKARKDFVAICQDTYEGPGQIVRCKDCEFYTPSKYTESGFYCGQLSGAYEPLEMDPEDFCSYGKKKKEAKR